MRAPMGFGNTAMNFKPKSNMGTSARTYTRSSRPDTQFKLNSYKHELEIHGQTYAAIDQRFQVLTPDRIANVVKIYDASLNANLALHLLGQSKSVWNPLSLHNFGGNSDQPWKAALQTPYAADWKNNPAQIRGMKDLDNLIATNPEHLRQGAILLEQNWTVPKNAAFINGGVDSGREFHVATNAKTSLDIPISQLYNPTERRPTVLLQELITLHESGYKRASHDYGGDYGQIYLGNGNNHHAPLGGVNKVIEDIKTEGDVTQYLKSVEAEKKEYFLMSTVNQETPAKSASGDTESGKGIEDVD